MSHNEENAKRFFFFYEDLYLRKPIGIMTKVYDTRHCIPENENKDWSRIKRKMIEA